jgi:hypothetical protein
MWNVFKFFFVWFWLSLAGSVLIAGVMWFRLGLSNDVDPTTSQFEAMTMANVYYTVPLFFVLAIPSYFIARPKRHRSSASMLDHPY